MAVRAAQILGARHAAREIDGGFAAGSELIDHRAARVAQTEEAGDFVVGFTGGVVKRRAKLAHGLADGLYFQQLRMPARDQEGHRVRQLFAFQVGHGNVAAEVVNAVERHAPGRSIGLGGRGSHQQSTG